MGPAGEPGVEISVKVMRESHVKMAMKKQHDALYINHFDHCLPSALSALAAID